MNETQKEIQKRNEERFKRLFKKLQEELEILEKLKDEIRKRGESPLCPWEEEVDDDI